MSTFVISPAMSGHKAPDWEGSCWIGEVDLNQDADDFVLDGSEGYSRARLLVRDGRHPLGFIEFAIDSGRISQDELKRSAAALPRRVAAPERVLRPSISVVLCTRDRPEALETAISSLLTLDYPDFEVVIVDNASRTDDSKQVVSRISDQRVRLVSEPRPGLAKARNLGVRESTKEIVAFTDDDVVVDEHWLTGLADGFASADDVACVCGIVPTGELRSYSQAYFDGRVVWANNFVPRIYRLSEPPAESLLFPFQVGLYGTGANFAMRRSTILELGGFDEALGVGSPTRSGEDIDIFVRTLLAGHALSVQPSALVWHRHRADMESLHVQMSGYGLGLGAWIGKLLGSRRTAVMVLRRAARGVLHARAMTKVNVAQHGPAAPEGLKRSLAATELWAIARGPFAYLRARLAGAQQAPLSGPKLPGMDGQSELRKSICIVGSGFYFLSGLSVYNCRLANALTESHDVSVILLERLIPTRLYPGVSRAGKALTSLKYLDSVKILGRLNWYWGAEIGRTIRHLKAERPNMLVLEWWTAASLHTYLALAIAARRFGIPVVIEFHEAQDTGEAKVPFVARYARWLMPRLLARASGALVHNQHDLELVRHTYGASVIDRLVVESAPHGPYDHLRKPAADSEIGSAAAVDDVDGVTRLLFFGVIRPYKGLEDLVAAFNSLTADEAANFKLTVVGETWEQWTLPGELIESSPHRSRIEFINRYVTDDEAGEFFHRADAVILPYRRASASGPMHLAMSAGLHVVVYAVGGLVDAVRDYEGAILVPSDDQDALRAAILTLPSRRTERFVDPHSWDATISALDRIAQAVLPKAS